MCQCKVIKLHLLNCFMVHNLYIIVFYNVTMIYIVRAIIIAGLINKHQSVIKENY